MCRLATDNDLNRVHNVIFWDRRKQTQMYQSDECTLYKRRHYSQGGRSWAITTWKHTISDWSALSGATCKWPRGRSANTQAVLAISLLEHLFLMVLFCHPDTHYSCIRVRPVSILLDCDPHNSTTIQPIYTCYNTLGLISECRGWISVHFQVGLYQRTEILISSYRSVTCRGPSNRGVTVQVVLN